MAMNNAPVFWALLRRDLKIIRQSIFSELLDVGCLLTMQVLVFGKFLPLMGMPQENIAPLYLVSICQMLFLLGFNLAFNRVFDLKFDRFIEYHLSLPLNKKWLFGEYIVSFMIKCLVVSLPLVTAGLFLLRSVISLAHANWILFFIMYLLALLFFALFFQFLSFYYEFHWFLDNVWPRRLSPLFLLSASFFTWHKVYHFSKPLGIFFLCNPFTYITEGFRSTLLGGYPYLPIVYCVSVIALCNVLLIRLLAHAVKKTLNPV